MLVRPNVCSAARCFACNKAGLHRLILVSVLCATAHARAEWWPAGERGKIHSSGTWTTTTHRYAAEPALATREPGAALEFSTEARLVVLGLDTLTPPNHYGPPELGRLDVFVNGTMTLTVRPRVEDREVVLLRAPAQARREIRIVHQADAGGTGARVRGIRLSNEPSGDLAWRLSAEHQPALCDARAILSRQGRVLREALVRNWLSGQCRLAGLPPGDDYTLELRAIGWAPARIERIAIRENEETRLDPIHLKHAWDPPGDDFKFPAIGRAAVIQPGGGVRARFAAHQTAITGARLVRRVGPATVSRACEFDEDKAAAYYYHREGSVRVPADTPPGLYDLEIALSTRAGLRTLVSPRSVSVVADFPTDPTFFSFGHLDTWGQYQAEYLERMVAMANLVAPDVVLDSTEANPAYAAGALLGLEMPCLVNFGNHRAPEPEPWFSASVGAVDFGRAFTVLNFGRAWDSDTDTAAVQALLAARQHTALKVLNAFESNPPVAGLLDRHRIALLHHGHGPGPKVEKVGATPTLLVGKTNSESFRLIRFRDGRVLSATYRGHATAPIPFRRGDPAPVRVTYQPANDGTARTVTAQVINELEERLPRARLVLVVPAGAYRANRGTIESAIASDDGRFTVVSVRVDLEPQSTAAVILTPR